MRRGSDAQAWLRAEATLRLPSLLVGFPCPPSRGLLAEPKDLGLGLCASPRQLLQRRPCLCQCPRRAWPVPCRAGGTPRSGCIRKHLGVS